ncbi:hypothetical protein RHMOL_Rhmol10G0066800 [Rhododendron molle]|uniref:Uncharacterized protein n=1 Tax=Rhododendron molle TaxID=49168 RepID=A0ACC0M072_RHOML|nr:hypothetical protein RHMOL_Rhmol10G0066800 [Rhododendron molle]
MHFNVLSITTPLCLLLNQILFSVATTKLSVLYHPIDNIAVNCGSSGNSTAVDGRQWTGDIGSSYAPLLHSTNEGKLISSKATNPSLSPDPVPYASARLSRWPFTYAFRVSPGQKFVRLHFYPARYRGGFKRSKAFFTVKAGPYTLLSNFSASLTADASGLDSLVKEYCVNVEENQPLIMTFSPSLGGSSDDQAYAFVNGIEIVSMPAGLYHTQEGDAGAHVIGQNFRLPIDKSIALEMVQRLNVGGTAISSIEDTGLFRDWSQDSNFLMETSYVQPVTSTLRIKYTSIPSYTAPQKVYQTSWSMATDRQGNGNFNFTWKLPIDFGFRYLLRLHFCDFEYEIEERDRTKFSVFFDEHVAEAKADIIKWSGGNRVAVYRDYVVRIEEDRMEGKHDLLIAYFPHNHEWIEDIDTVLKGLEVFKLSNPDKNLAGVNPMPLSYALTSSNAKPQKSVYASGGNAIATILEMILVYEYMEHGTLADHLYKHYNFGDNTICHLSWEQRMKICIGAARGLDYLHTGTRRGIIHRDVKTTNILLNKDWVAKISDFGLCKEGTTSHSHTHVSTNVKGTFGYLDPEYFLTRRLTKKSDVYAFGVVLLEVLCGRPPVDLRLEEEQHSLSRWAQQCIKEEKLDQLVDQSVRDQISPECLKVFTEVANKCLHEYPSGRPTMSDVVASLEWMLASQEQPRNACTEEEEEEKGEEEEEDVASSSTPVQLNVDTQRQKRSRKTLFRRLAGVMGIQSPAKIFAGSDKRVNQAQMIIDDVEIRTTATNGSTSQATNTGPSSDESNITGNLRLFSYSKLENATKNFRIDNYLGKGRFGRVYKGWLDAKVTSKNGSGIVVAIKWMDYRYKHTVGHSNLVKILGCGFWEDEYPFEDHRKLILVYEFMQNGSLEQHLFGSVQPLPWDIRLKILIGAAQGLAFLHALETPVICKEFKASNILLDESFNSKISDFNYPESHSPDWSGLSGCNRFTYPVSKPYIAPEYIDTGHVSVKSDVYSFGVVLLEMLTGLRARDMNRQHWQHNLVDWVKHYLADRRKLATVIDSRLKGRYPMEAALGIAHLAQHCLEDIPGTRPSMKQVVETLEQGRNQK